MGCNCKGNNSPKPLDELVGYELINKGIINEEILSNNEKELLYRFYNEKFNEQVRFTCGNCWEVFIKDKLKELWIKESLRRAQS
jgi:hypothetical protein